MSELLPEAVYKQFLEYGDKWADARGAAELLEGTQKRVKSKIAIEHKKHFNCSMAEAEHRALASGEYTESMEKAVEARRLATRALVGYEAVKALWEARRSVEASERAANRNAQ